MASTLRAKSFLVAAAFLAGTTLLTACQGDPEGAASPSKTGAAAAAKDSSPKTGGAAAAGVEAAAKSKGKGISGTFAGGTVEYLAPGKHIVNANGKEQQFWVAEDTKVYGAGTICGKLNPAADTPCTVEDLEKILKDGSIAADVVMKNGIATKITERPAPDEGPAVDDSPTGAPESAIDGINKGKGVNGTWFGNVAYLAPGKFTVSDMKGTEQQFFLAEDTDIWGYGDICGDDAGQAGTECTEEELEAATKGTGVSAEVIIVNGIATTIRDDH